MKSKEQLREIAKDVLSVYPTKNAVIFTSDNTPFVDEYAADAHKQTLEDKTLVEISRVDATAKAVEKKVVEPNPTKEETEVVVKEEAKPTTKEVKASKK